MSNQTEMIINNSDDEINSSNIKVVEKPKRKYVKKAEGEKKVVSKKTTPALIVVVEPPAEEVKPLPEISDNISEVSFSEDETEESEDDHSVGCVNCGDEDDEDEIAKAIAMLQAKQAEVKKRKQVKSKAAEYRQTLIANRQEKIQKLKAELEKLAGEIQVLENEYDDNQLIDLITGDPKLEAELKIVAEKPAEKVASKKAVSKKVIVKPAGSRNEKMPPKARWAMLPEGSVFKCFQKDKCLYFKKSEDGDLDFCDETGKLIKNQVEGVEWDIENPIQSAANTFKKYAGITYHISGWEFCQLYNVETKKHKSLKRWDGDAEYIKF
jgi:hypothetical protein